jgi:hypothetical protein
MILGGVEPGGALAEWVVSPGRCPLDHDREWDMCEYMPTLKEGVVVMN